MRGMPTEMDLSVCLRGRASYGRFDRLGQEVELPICQAVHIIMNLGWNPGHILSDLFERSLKSEF